MLRNATARERAIISLLTLSDLRLERLGNYDGTDSIRLKDIEGIKIGPKGVLFTVIHAALKVRQSKVQLSKKGHAYITSILDQGVKYVRDYYNQRILSGETLSPDSPVIRKYGRGSNLRESGILATIFLERNVRDTIGKLDSTSGHTSSRFISPS